MEGSLAISSLGDDEGTQLALANFQEAVNEVNYVLVPQALKDEALFAYVLNATALISRFLPGVGLVRTGSHRNDLDGHNPGF